MLIKRLRDTVIIRFRNYSGFIDFLLPNRHRNFYARCGPPPYPTIPPEEKKVIEKWHNRIETIFPDKYNKCLQQCSYLSAFLIQCNFIEFYLIQYLFEFSLFKNLIHKNNLIASCLKRLDFLPNKIRSTIIATILKLLTKFERKPNRVIRVPKYYINNKYTLGALIQEAERKKLDKEIIDNLNKFNGRRNLIIHNLLDLAHIDKDIVEECKKACEIGEKTLELLKNSPLRNLEQL